MKQSTATAWRGHGTGDRMAAPRPGSARAEQGGTSMSAGKPSALPVSGLLTPSEIEQLRQYKKDVHAWLRKVYPNARPA